MKKLLLLELVLLFLATTFQSDNPPGWYQQILLVNDVVKDISFIDSSRGWIITEGNFNNHDTGYIMRTTNGGMNWTIQYDTTETFNVIQFVNENIGYAGGGFGRASFWKTIDGGNNWQYSIPFGSYNILDLKFINKDTGWACSDDDFDGGVFKSTNGGNNWQRQTTPSQLRPIKLFFINQDTGWALNDANSSIYKTTNGGSNWFFLNSISFGLRDMFFLNNDTGWIIRQQGVNSIIKTTDGGLNWIVQHDPTQFGPAPQDIYIINDSTGWIAEARFTILSLVNDSIWGGQSIPSGFPVFYSIQMNDTNIGYSGGTIFVKTTDGGGLITNTEESFQNIPDNLILYQNYPNPFNPGTKINYELRITGYISLKVFDVLGNEVATLVNQKQNAGNYEFEFNGAQLSSGIYFYRLEVLDSKSNELFIQTKKMMLIR